MAKNNKRRHSSGNSNLKYGALEQRNMFAGVSMEVINGLDTIVIDGTSGDDVAEVHQSDNGQIEVQFNDQDHRFDAAERIRFLGRSGDDTFVNNTDVSSSAFGHDGDDTLRGGNGNNWLQGGAGNDRLFGGDRNDMIRGRAGNDYIEAGKRHDRIFGGPGNDNIFGQSGRDVIQGEAGNDVIHGNNGDDRINGGEGINNISLGDHVNGDVALFDAVFQEFDVDSDGSEVTLTRGNRVDMITGIERAKFKNTTLNQADLDLQINAMENAILDRLNRLRSNEGLAPLTIKADLTEFGRNWIAENGYGHSNPDDWDPLFVGNRSSAGENIGFQSGSSSIDQIADRMHASWANSSFHYANMTRSSFSEVGIAAVKLSDGWYFLQFFMG